MKENIVKDLVGALKPDTTTKESKYQAIVSHVDDEGIVWVYVAGSEMETPTASTSAEVKSGDAVTVEWRNNKLYIAGNYSNPSAGTQRVASVERDAQRANIAAASAVDSATQARTAADTAVADANRASQAASDAQTSADAANNALKSVVTGATTVEKAVSVMQTALEAVVDYDPTAKQGTFTGDGTETAFALSEKATNILSVTVDGESAEYTASVVDGVTVITFATAPASGASIVVSYDTTQEYFWHDSNGAHVLGDTSGYRNDIDSTGMRIVDAATENAVAEFGAETTIKTTDGTELAHFGYALGQAQSGTAIAPYYTMGQRRANSTVGNYSMAEGQITSASGIASHAEGVGTNASGIYSHAEGSAARATGDISHAEGRGSLASGAYSHSEGYYAEATGKCSHAQNEETIASKRAQTAIGTFNKEDTASATTHPSGNVEYGKYAFMIGNGTSEASVDRSNALTVDWDGDLETAGDVTDGSGNVLSEKSTITTQSYDLGTVSFTAGTVGTVGQNKSATITKTGYTPIALAVRFVSSTSLCTFSAFMNNTRTSAYVQVIRAVASAQTINYSLYLDVTYLKN